MECKFNDAMHEAGVEVKLDTQAIPKKDDFKYVESVIQGSRNNDYDIINHIDTRCGGLPLKSCVIKMYHQNLT